MKSRVIQLLEPAHSFRKTLSVSMDSRQMEMIDKLALFFSEKSGQKLSRNQVIEQALDGFIDVSVEVIQQQFEMDIRMITLAELNRNQNVCTIDVTELDTVIVPAKDNDAYHNAFFRRNEWRNVRIREDKLRQIHYFAVYVGAPTSGITHYAKITDYHHDEDNPGRYVIRFEEPEPLPQTVEAEDSTTAAGMRSCRYTALFLLQRAHTIRELFSPGEVFK